MAIEIVIVLGAVILLGTLTLTWTMFGTPEKKATAETDEASSGNVVPLVIVLAASLLGILGILPNAALLQLLGGQKTASGKRLYAFRETFKVARRFW